MQKKIFFFGALQFSPPFPPPCKNWHGSRSVFDWEPIWAHFPVFFFRELLFFKKEKVFGRKWQAGEFFFLCSTRWTLATPEMEEAAEGGKKEGVEFPFPIPPFSRKKRKKGLRFFFQNGKKRNISVSIFGKNRVCIFDFYLPSVFFIFCLRTDALYVYSEIFKMGLFGGRRETFILPRF